MFQVMQFAVLALAASSASAIVLTRATPPAGWLTDLLESYEEYHARYLALNCNTQHSSAFFDDCCHPLLASQKLSSRPARCNPALSSTAPSMPPKASSAPKLEDYEDYEDCEDDDLAHHNNIPVSAAPAAKFITAPAPSPATSAVSTVTSTPSVQNAVVVVNAAPKLVLTQLTSATTYTGGYATYYYQNGVAGACGKVHSDNDLIAAIDGNRYGNLGAVSPLCGKQVRITNNKNGQSVTVTIADACPTCQNSNSIDLSEFAFKKIATLSEGIVPISWSYL